MKFNTDVTDMLDRVFPDISSHIRSEFNFVSRVNGYLNQENDKYFVAYYENGRTLPIPAVVIFHTPWEYPSWFPNRLVFSKTYKVTLRTYYERIETIGISLDSNDFSDLEEYTLEMEFPQSVDTNRKINKAQTKKINKWLSENMVKLTKQIDNRVIELMPKYYNKIEEYNPDLILRYMTEDAKEAFIF